MRVGCLDYLALVANVSEKQCPATRITNTSVLFDIDDQSNIRHVIYI